MYMLKLTYDANCMDKDFPWHMAFIWTKYDVYCIADDKRKPWNDILSTIAEISRNCKRACYRFKSDKLKDAAIVKAYKCAGNNKWHIRAYWIDCNRVLKGV